MDAIIRNADLEFEYDNRFLCLNLWLESEERSWKFGGVNLGNRFTKEFNPTGGEYAFWWIKRVFDVADVVSMSELNGKTLRMRLDDNDKIIAIGHIIKNDWFCPEDDFKKQ